MSVSAANACGWNWRAKLKFWLKVSGIILLWSETVPEQSRTHQMARRLFKLVKYYTWDAVDLHMDQSISIDPGKPSVLFRR
jgi:hypothetical protein